MRIIPEPACDAISKDDGTVGYLDWKDGPLIVLNQVDALLAAHGLEVVRFETDADDYLFKIEKRVVI